MESFESGTGSKPSTPEEVARLSPEELSQKLESQADFTLVDTRSREAYDKGHIKGAIWVPLAIIKDGLWKPAPDQELVLYWEWPQEATSARAALELIKQGYSRVKVLSGGYKDWKAAGYPVEMAVE